MNLGNAADQIALSADPPLGMMVSFAESPVLLGAGAGVDVPANITAGEGSAGESFPLALRGQSERDRTAGDVCSIDVVVNSARRATKDSPAPSLLLVGLLAATLVVLRRR